MMSCGRGSPIPGCTGLTLSNDDLQLGLYMYRALGLTPSPYRDRPVPTYAGSWPQPLSVQPPSKPPSPPPTIAHWNSFLMHHTLRQTKTLTRKSSCVTARGVPPAPRLRVHFWGGLSSGAPAPAPGPGTRHPPPPPL